VTAVTLSAIQGFSPSNSCAMIFATLEGREPVVVLVRGYLCGLLVAICRQFRTAQHAIASTHLPFFLPAVIPESTLLAFSMSRSDQSRTWTVPTCQIGKGNIKVVAPREEKRRRE